MVQPERKKEFLNVAMDFSEWIMTSTEQGIELSIKILNKMQIIKRTRPLNTEERKLIMNIIKDESQKDIILAGAHLLLDNYDMAEIYYEKLEPKLKDEFRSFPIYHFWKSEE